MNNLHYECVKHWNEVVSRNTCINGITIRICFQNPCLHNIYNMQEHGCNYSNTSFSHGHMIQFCISCTSLIANAGLSYYVYIYIYISEFNCLKRASTTHQQQTTHLGTNEEQVSLCQSNYRFRWKINKPAGPGETWGMMRHHNTTKNENHQGEVHRTHQMQRPRPNRDKMEEVWRGRFEEGDSSLQCRQSSLDKLGMVENGEPKKRMFTRDQGRQVSKRTESLNMPSFFWCALKLSQGQGKESRMCIDLTGPWISEWPEWLHAAWPVQTCIHRVLRTRQSWPVDLKP